MLAGADAALQMALTEPTSQQQHQQGASPRGESYASDARRSSGQRAEEGAGSPEPSANRAAIGSNQFADGTGAQIESAVTPAPASGRREDRLEPEGGLNAATEDKLQDHHDTAAPRSHDEADSWVLKAKMQIQISHRHQQNAKTDPPAASPSSAMPRWTDRIQFLLQLPRRTAFHEVADVVEKDKQVKLILSLILRKGSEESEGGAGGQDAGQHGVPSRHARRPKATRRRGRGAARRREGRPRHMANRKDMASPDVKKEIDESARALAARTRDRSTPHISWSVIIAGVPRTS